MRHTMFTCAAFWSAVAAVSVDYDKTALVCAGAFALSGIALIWRMLDSKASTPPAE